MSDPVLVGRDAELGVLRAELERARLGQLRSVLVTGDPGVGKTRLARELLASPGVTALSARGYPLGESSAFGLWAEALERHLRVLAREEIAALCAGSERDLAAVLRSVAAVVADVPSAEPPRARLLGALAGLLANLAARRPVVLLLDDVHLADASSLEALHYVAHSCSDARILVLATARAGELAEHGAASSAALRLEQDGMLRRVPIDPLDGAALRALTESVLGETAPAALVSWLDERSRGNALFAVGLLQALLDADADLTAPALRTVPETLAERIALRLDQLDACAIDTVERLAVLGRRVELRTLVAVTGRPAGEVALLLERLVRTGLVTEAEQGLELTYETAHPLVSDAVYQRIGAARRRGLHRDVGRALLASGALGQAAPHFVRSAEPGDAEAVEVLCDAVRRAERAGAYQEALPVLAALVELLASGDPRWRRVVDGLDYAAPWVLDHRADEHTALGIDALRAMDAALGSVDDPAPRAQIKLRLANFLAWGGGGLAEAERIGRDSVTLFEHAGDQRGALLAAHELAYIAGLRGRTAEMQAGCEQVVGTARARNDRVVLARALRTLDQAALWRGEFAAGHAANDELLALARADGDRHRESLALTMRGGNLVLQGRIAEGLAALEEAGTAGAGADAALPHRLIVWSLAGEYRRARAGVPGLRDGTGRFGHRQVGGLMGAALATAEHGEVAEARRYCLAMNSLLDGRDWAPFSYGAAAVTAVCTWLGGRGDDALPALRDAADRTLQADAIVLAMPHIVEWAELAARLGRPDPAAAEQLARVPARTGAAPHRALTDLALAWTAFGSGDQRGAVGAAAASAAELERCGWTAYLARAQLVQGLAESDRERAVSLLRSAAQAFDACGALVRRDWSLEALAKLGSQGRRAASAAAGPSSLTAREREVARLAATGLSAREIGAALFITQRTVEGHLARAYARLGVRSKAELAHRAAELGLAPGR